MKSSSSSSLFVWKRSSSLRGSVFGFFAATAGLCNKFSSSPLSQHQGAEFKHLIRWRKRVSGLEFQWTLRAVEGLCLGAAGEGKGPAEVSAVRASSEAPDTARLRERVWRPP